MDRRVFLALLPLVVAGCGQSGKVMIQVEGTVRMDGQPLTNGYINFEPVNEKDGDDAASGVIGPDGRYFLRTRKPRDGITPGAYRVAVRSDSGPIREGIPGPSAVPLEYTSADRSPLSADVKPEPASQTIDFDIKGK